MIRNANLAVLALVAMMGVSAPAFAQAPRHELKTGTGRNREMLEQSTYRPVYNYVAPNIQSQPGGFQDYRYRFDPSLNGGGSSGYNFMLRHD